MANRWPIASGNWSAAAIWSGSLIPTASDDVFLNNRVVTLDQDIIVASINNTATGSAIAGGLLSIFSDYNITATPNGISSNDATVTGGFIKYYNTGSITIIATFLQTRNTLENVNGGTINIIGDVRLPLIGVITNGRTVTNSSNGTINIVGNITCPGNTTSGNHAVLNSLNGTINVIGNVIGGNNGANCHGIVNNSNGIISITGNVVGGIASTVHGISNASVGTVNVTGNTIGGTSTTSHAINNASIGTVNVTGIVTAGSSTGTGINSTTAGIINVIGQLQATTTANAISSTSTTATNLFTGPFYNTGSFNAVYAYRMQMLEPTSTTWQFDTEVAGVSKTLYTANQLPGVPRQNDVRKGTQYNFGLTGSLEMPDPTTVKQGVAADNTTGSAILTAQDMFDVLTQDIIATGSIGETLKNASTIQTTAATISSFKV